MQNVKQPLAIMVTSPVTSPTMEEKWNTQAFVVDHLQPNLLGLPANSALNLAVRADSVQATVTAENIWKKFLKVF